MANSAPSSSLPAVRIRAITSVPLIGESPKGGWSAEMGEMLGWGQFARFMDRLVDNLEAGRPLPLDVGLNPAWAEAIATLRRLVVQPLLGEFFTKEQNKPGADKVVVLTQSFWQTQFSEDPAVLGKKVRLGGESYVIIGVAPRVFEAWDARVKYVVPLSWQPAQENPQGRYGVGLQLFGRLKPGVAAGHRYE